MPQSSIDKPQIGDKLTNLTCFSHVCLVRSPIPFPSSFDLCYCLNSARPKLKIIHLLAIIGGRLCLAGTYTLDAFAIHIESTISITIGADVCLWCVLFLCVYIICLWIYYDFALDCWCYRRVCMFACRMKSFVSYILSYFYDEGGKATPQLLDVVLYVSVACRTRSKTLFSLPSQNDQKGNIQEEEDASNL